MNEDAKLWLLPQNRIRQFYLLLILNFGCIVALQITGAELKNEVASAGIVSYEFAGDMPNAQNILNSWDAETKITVGINLGIDYLFLLLYSQAIALGCLLVGQYGKMKTSIISLIANLQFVAAFLDAIENYALIQLLTGSKLDFWPSIAYWSALPKFTLVAIGLLFILYAGVKGAIQKK